MSNIFNTNEMEAIIKRIEETYNVSGKKVKLTIEIIDENKDTTNNESHNDREKEVISVVEDLFDKMQDRDIDSESLVSSVTEKSLSGIKYDLTSIRRQKFYHSNPTLLSIDVEKYTYYDYKVTINYRRVVPTSIYKVMSNMDAQLYMVIGKDNKISKISEKDFD